jgi:tRNA threonylcarbamoyladenosine biosynthesis protein TsaB
MPTILALDTATSVASCALIRDGALLGERAAAARSVLAAADDLLAAAGLEPAGLDGIVVGTGPGSFTSIRMGLALVRGLALATGVPVAGASTLHAFTGGDPVIDAKRGEVFAAGGVVAAPESLSVSGRKLVGDGAVRYRAVFAAAGAEIPPDDDPSHLPHAQLLLPFASAFGPAGLVEPTYLRAPDAVASARAVAR